MRCPDLAIEVQKTQSTEHPPTLTSFAEGYGGQEATEDRESKERRAKSIEHSSLRSQAE
jgi:hypothetical protein